MPQAPAHKSEQALERMRLVRDDIAARVAALARDLDVARGERSGPATH